MANDQHVEEKLVDKPLFCKCFASDIVYRIGHWKVPKNEITKYTYCKFYDKFGICHCYPECNQPFLKGQKCEKTTADMLTYDPSKELCMEWDYKSNKCKFCKDTAIYDVEKTVCKEGDCELLNPGCLICDSEKCLMCKEGFVRKLNEGLSDTCDEMDQNGLPTDDVQRTMYIKYCVNQIVNFKHKCDDPMNSHS